jgi:phosphatidylglycerophosphatase A
MSIQEIVTLIYNIVGTGLVLAFTIGLIIGIRFLIHLDQHEKEEDERKKHLDEIEYKEHELRYQQLLSGKK